MKQAAKKSLWLSSSPHPLEIHLKTTFSCQQRSQKYSSSKIATGPLTTNQTRMASLLGLPSEIQLDIIQCLEHDDLKKLRVCKQLDPLIVPQLFQQLTLYPHANFLMRVGDVLQNFHNLSDHITKIVYDCHWVDLIINLHHSYERFQYAQIMEPEVEQAVAYYKTDLLMDDDDCLRESALLHRIIAQISRLACFEYIGVFDPWVTIGPDRTLPQFYDRIWQLKNPRLGWKRNERNFSKFIRVFSGCSRDSLSCALTTRNILTILESISSEFRCELRCSDLSSLFGIAYKASNEGPAAIVKSALKKIRYLSYNRFLDATGTDFRSRRYANLAFMPRDMESLETLQIDVGHFESYQLWLGKHSNSASSLISSSKFKVLETRVISTNLLRSLTLEDFSCDEDMWYQLLSEASHSLKSLTLNTFVLLHSVGDNSRPCLVRMIKFFQSKLQLEKVLLCGRLSNGGRQDWLVIPPGFGLDPVLVDQLHKKTGVIEPVNPKSLEQQVRNFILNGGICPLESEAVPDAQTDLPDHVRNHQAQDRGDESWVIRGSSFVQAYLSEQSVGNR